MDLSPRGLTRSAGRVGATARSMVEVTFRGGLEVDEESSPYEVVSTQRVYRLRRYFPERAQTEPNRIPIVLVPPLMLTAEVYDVSQATSGVRIMAEHGLDPWVVDFGAPEREEGGLTRTLTDHVLAVNDAVDRVRAATGRDVHLAGYSQGGMFSYQVAAYRRSEGLISVITFGSPVDARAAIPLGLPEDLVVKGLGFLTDTVFAQRHLPAWASRTGFRLMDPAKSLRQRLDFLLQLHNREALLPREKQRRFLMGEGFVAYPGPAMAEAVRQFVAHNRMLSGGFTIADRLVTLADITCPLLCFVGETDSIGAPVMVRALPKAAPRAEVYEVSMPVGHFGLVVGGKAARITWPTVAAWARWQEGAGERPEGVQELTADKAASSARARLGYGLDLAANVGIGAAHVATSTVSGGVRTVRSLAGEASHQLPRLYRLEHVEPSTRISMGLLLDENARKRPGDTFFVFAGRGHTYAAAKRRIDNIVRGLISVGVRQGEHVGVLMDIRPSAIAVLAALNRLGAVVVLMRPDGSVAREVELGQITRIIADPEHGPQASEATNVPVLVLGGGGETRELGFGLTDMERIDPDQIPLPAWYTANPGQAQDLAFILFTGEGSRTRVNRITNQRWALSAFGTASAAALSSADTVYSITPIHHPSGLLTSIGGAIAGGSRLALATSFDPATFWEEVRRYGVTAVSYTWNLLHDLVEGPPNPAEHHHPVRLFMGSGMPTSLWRRTVKRFAPARVLEFYASTEGAVVLVNLSGEKIGAKGRPLPGSAEVHVAAYDPESGRLLQGRNGYAIECPDDEPGMLLARVTHDRGVLGGTPLRGLFSPGDAWLATGALFRRDADGDHWLVDQVSELIRTAGGVIPSIPIEDALGVLDAVDLAVAYGVPAQPGGHDLAIAALTLRNGHELDTAELDAALAGLGPGRPDVVRVVKEIPLTTWYRPIKGLLRHEGIPRGDSLAWYLDRDTDTYRVLNDKAVKRLIEKASAR